MKEITKKEFYDLIMEGQLDVNPCTLLPISDNPQCKIVWKDRRGVLFGVEIDNNTVYPPEEKFYVNEDFLQSKQEEKR